MRIHIVVIGIIGVLVITFLLCCEQKKRAILVNNENDTLSILKLGLDSVYITDIEEAKMQGKYLIWCEQPRIRYFLSKALNDSVEYIDNHNLCHLEYPGFFMEINSFEHFVDSANVHFFVKCILKRAKDTCLTGNLCGGNLVFRTKKNEGLWKIAGTTGTDD